MKTVYDELGNRTMGTREDIASYGEGSLYADQLTEEDKLKVKLKRDRASTILKNMLRRSGHEDLVRDLRIRMKE